MLVNNCKSKPENDDLLLALALAAAAVKLVDIRGSELSGGRGLSLHILEASEALSF